MSKVAATLLALAAIMAILPVTYMVYFLGTVFLGVVDMYGWWSGPAMIGVGALSFCLAALAISILGAEAHREMVGRFHRHSRS